MIQYDDRPVKWMIYPAIIFMILGMLFGVYISINGFLTADYFSGEYVHFGRVRPVHVNQVLFLWLLSASLGLTYFMVQRLCGTPLWSSRLALTSCVLWWFSLVLATYSYPFGTNYGWEYNEMPMWISYIPVKPIFFISWILCAITLGMTIFNRKIEKMYVSLWYIMGTLLWVTVTLWTGGYSLEFIPGGISRVNASFFYMHNLVGLIFTPLGLAQAYYFLPKIANTPIYSHRLSMIGFWSIAFVYAWVGSHHIIHGPVSQWLQTTSIIFSVWLFIPVWTAVTNLMSTVSHDWKKYIISAPVRFILMGVSFYLLTSVQGTLMAFRNVNEITSKTDWIIGHSHIALYGAFTYFAIAGVYYVIPVITQKTLWSEKLAEWHFTLNLFGSVFFMAPLWFGGYLQGLQWASWATGSSYAEFHSNLTNLPFIQTISDMRPWWYMRSFGGTVILIGNILFVVNMYNTILLQPRASKEEVLKSLQGSAA